MTAAAGAVEGEERATPGRGSGSTHSATTSASLSARSAVRPLGSPISPVAPPTSASGRCPACCSRRAVSNWTRLPTCRLGAVGSKPHVEGDRAGVEGVAQRVEVGALGDQPAPLQVVEELGGGGHVGPSRSCPVPREPVRYGRQEPSLPDRAAGRRRSTAARYGDTVGSPSSQNRHGCPAPSPATPTRGPVTATGAGVTVAGGPARAGRHHERRPRAGRVGAVEAAVDAERDGEPGRPAGQVAWRARRRAPREGQRRWPSTTSPARSSTADAVPTGPQTRFMHQCMP